ncbi:leucine-rich repeat-containing protein 71 isoform X2 [Betta splendens]|uniref:Leucine-rich repeat-containing protein 71 isoform X2 n=1 Tax=Betta splendens TaxID=158456 RepID=A0A6P7NR83_BETSP|nr:leucine-rich repeat-containing protein 71 isoform X2 [Betta splendens]
MSRKKSAKDKTERATVEEDDLMCLDEYQCSGNVEIDFPGLCALLDIEDIPSVSIKHPVSESTTEEEGQEDNQAQVNSPYKPCLQVELENESPLSVKGIKISGWKVDEQIARALTKMLPSLSQLQSLHLYCRFWQARLTDQMVISLMSTISLCSSLRAVAIEGNTLPQQSYHLLLAEDSVITQLSLRNNRIGDEGCRLIGSALSTARSTNKNLLSLNLAFNSIGDAGAAHIAQGLRLNRALLFLSLSNNHIGDSGAAHLAAILGKFALTHEEVVMRRRLLVERAESAPAAQFPTVPSSSSLTHSKGELKGISTKKEASKKEEKTAVSKENTKSVKKTSEAKVPQSKGEKSGIKEKQLSTYEDSSNAILDEDKEAVEVVNPLLDQSVQHEKGRIFLPGNRTLISLNLSGNRITEKSLPLFLASLEMQGDGGGLSRLCLQRNRFPPDCEPYVKIKELMALREPLEVSSPEPTEEEGQNA